MSDEEDDEEVSAATGAAMRLHPTPTARLLLLIPPLQIQQRLWPKRPRLDLCAMHGIKNTAMQKTA